MTAEIVLMWAGVTLYAVGSILLTLGVVFDRAPLRAFGIRTAFVGALPHALALGVRWARTGHAPFLGFYEVVSSLTLVTLCIYAVLAWRSRKLAVVGVVVIPVAFLLTAAAMFAPKTDFALTGTLASWWLVIHITFSKLAYGCFIIACAFSVFYLTRERLDHDRWKHLLQMLPAQDLLDSLAYRFNAAGFIFLSVMIATGSVWANEAWGRYWGWDPIETWSVISWLVYATYLHLRRFMGWHGRKAAWLSVAALALVLFTLLGVPLVYSSVHSVYLLGR